MIGLGRWSCGLDTPLVEEDGVVQISEKEGKYVFRLLARDKNIPDYRVESIREKDGNTLIITLTIEGLPEESEVRICATFTETELTGYIRLPFIGKINIIRGKRIK
ncbi:MAG: hypothetical protein MJ125_02935 [Clostridia bacterium]|nr:hypothetical protein [Clostridia bacterium]